METRRRVTIGEGEKEYTGLSLARSHVGSDPARPCGKKEGKVLDNRGREKSTSARFNRERGKFTISPGGVIKKKSHQRKKEET